MICILLITVTAGVRALYYLDDVYVNFQVPESNVSLDVIGAKNVVTGR